MPELLRQPNKFDINLGIIDSSISYWALHFISILECLSHHKNLMFPAHKLKDFPILQLSHMKGNYPNSFWDQMENYMRNWGFQYFFVHFLNQNLGLNIVDKLKERLDDYFHIRSTFDYDDFKFFVSGTDSRLSLNLNKRYDEVYPKQFNLSTIQISNLESYSDFCLILKNNDEDQNIGIFGEIEGLHGEKLLTDSFWIDRKSEHCVIGLGTISGKDPNQIYIQDYFVKNRYPKVIVLFEQSHYIVQDFHYTLREFKSMFDRGIYYKCYSKDESFIFLVNYIIQNWNTPVKDILNFLYQYINTRDLIGSVEDESLNLIPSIDKK